MIGHVRWQVYTAYMKAVGTGLVLFVLLSLALMQVNISISHKLGFNLCSSHCSCFFTCCCTQFRLCISSSLHYFSLQVLVD